MPPADQCPWCRGLLQFDHVIALGEYDGELRRAVLRIKRLSGEGLSLALGQFLAQASPGGLGRTPARPDWPIPMHWFWRLTRGTNNPELLAGWIASQLRKPLARRLLVRRRNTRRQNDLPPSRRIHNVRQAFALRSGYDLRGKHVLLIDDVLTTGATCSTAAALLKQAGARVVSVAVLARAEGEKSRGVALARPKPTTGN